MLPRTNWLQVNILWCLCFKLEIFCNLLLIDFFVMLLWQFMLRLCLVQYCHVLTSQSHLSIRIGCYDVLVFDLNLLQVVDPSHGVIGAVFPPLIPLQEKLAMPFDLVLVSLSSHLPI